MSDDKSLDDGAGDAISCGVRTRWKGAEPSSLAGGSAGSAPSPSSSLLPPSTLKTGRPLSGLINTTLFLVPNMRRGEHSAVIVRPRDRLGPAHRRLGLEQLKEPLVTLRRLSTHCCFHWTQLPRAATPLPPAVSPSLAQRWPTGPSVFDPCVRPPQTARASLAPAPASFPSPFRKCAPQ